MTQEVPSRLELRKSFLIVGLVLLILGFFFFYWAGRVNWDYVTTYNDKVHFAYLGYPSGYPQFGAYEYYDRYVVMQPDDALTVSYPENTQINGSLKVVLVDDYGDNVLASSGYPFSDWVVEYRNEQANYVVVRVYLIAQNMQNVTVSSTRTLNHYTKPQLVYFGVGAVLLSLGAISVFERKERMINRKMLGFMIVIIGFVLVVSGLFMFGLLEPRTEYGIPFCWCLATVGPPPLYCYKTFHGLLFDSGLVLIASGAVSIIVFRKEKLNTKK